MSGDNIQVQMGFSSETVELVEETKNMLDAKNNTNVVVTAVKTLHFLLKEDEKGNSIFVRDEKKAVEMKLELLK